MLRKLADEVYPLFKSSFIDYGSRIEYTNPDDWKLERDKIIGIFSRYLKKEYPGLSAKVASKHDSNLFKVIHERVPPFGVFFVISGSVTPEHFLEVLLEGPVKELYADFVPEDDFVETLYAFYRQHKQHQEG